MYRCNSCDTPAEMGHHDDCPIHEKKHQPCPACIGTGQNLIHPQQCRKCGGTGAAKINIASGEDVIPHDYL